ncbi:hypothetical protein BKK79_26640 [Cupriavidus sp. USMAA2-4]|nr:hypothetical protein BKK79_26640 [Cupriavidus sp. USMAA2-4]
MPLYRLGGHAPAIAASAYVAAEATVIGRAELAAQASVWPGAVIRADNETMRGEGARTACLAGGPGFLTSAPARRRR